MGRNWIPKPIRCADCGVETLATHNATKFCPECAKRRRQESMARAYERVRLKRQAEKPEDPDEREIHYCDPPENIQRCLNCEKEDCSNCLFYERSAKKKAKKHFVPEEMKEKVVSLVGQKIPQREIAEILGVSPSTVSKWVAGLRWEGAL